MKIIRWPESLPPQEQKIYQQMLEQRLQPYKWSNGPGDTYAPHRHSYEKVLYCLRGSIRFTLPMQLDEAGQPVYVELLPGDCMILPPGICHSAQVGAQGVSCMEAARAQM